MASAFFANGRRAALSFSFDDARLSQIDRGMPLLKAHNVHATFYVSPENLERRLEGWRQALLAGHEVGNHTMTHPCTGNFPWSRAKALEDFTLDRMEAELTGANELVQRLLNVTPVTFAYPCGNTHIGRGLEARSYIPLVARHFIAGRGFLGEAANDPAFCDLAHLLSIASDELDFEALKGWVDSAIANGSWLVFAGHEISHGGRQVTRIAAMDALCQYCHERRDELWIDTVADIASHIRRSRGEVPDRFDGNGQRSGEQGVG
jgi:hypothetical protein